MQKEFLIAIVLGSAIGLFAAFGIWRANSAKEEEPETIPQETVNSTQSPPPQASAVSEGSSEFMVTSPAPNFTSTESKINIAGSTEPGTYVAIVTPSETLFVDSQSGNFSSQITLDEGLNEIIVYSIKPEGETNKVKLWGVYSSKLDQNATNFAMGTVTDITETSAQVRSTAGGIVQISLSENTSYVTTISNTKEVEFADLAIGDFVVVAGSQNPSSEILAASRVIIQTQPKESEPNTITGVVSEVAYRKIMVEAANNSDEITVSTTNKPTTTITENGEFQKASTSDTEEGYQIIAIGKLEDETLTADAIHLLSGN